MSESMKRKNLLTAYLDNMTTYIKIMHPEKSEEEIRAFVREKMLSRNAELKKNLKLSRERGEDPSQRKDCWPTVHMLLMAEEGSSEHSYGNMTEYKDYDLFKWTRDFADKIISPFCSCYETIDHQASFLKGMVDVKKAERKKEKKLMLQAKKEGNKTAETFHNNNQATIKINMNSYIGAMGSAFSNMSSPANFNSVTSIARFFIMNSYGHAERFMESNFYFRTPTQLINFIVGCIKSGPSDERIREVLSKYPFIKWPTADEVIDFLVGSLEKYDVHGYKNPHIPEFIRRLSPERLCFMFYMSNMKHLVFENGDFFHPWVDKLFSMDGVEYVDCKPGDVGKLDSDLAIVLSTVHNDMLPRNAKGNSISIYDCIAEYPELAKKLYCIGVHMQKCMDEIKPLFDLFMDHEVAIGYVAELKNMYRNAVTGSDTDSIIFTTKTWVQWYTGKSVVTQEAYKINALIVYWLSKANANILFHVSCNFGAMEADRYTMAMKNEFMMPVEIVTSLKKHYVSLLKIQEGVFYNEPRLDIKGVNLRGSNFSTNVLNYAEWFIKTLIYDIYETGSVDPQKKIREILQFERMIADSLNRGETLFLNIEPVKNKEDYADPNKTIYFNYLIWEKVFAEKYGSIVIPTKCYTLPLLGIRTPTFLEKMKKINPTMAKAWGEIFASTSKDINRIPLNPSVDKIPEEIRPFADFKSIISINTKPMYLIMQSLGIVTGGPTGKPVLFSDVYGWVTEEEGKQAIQHTV